MPRKTELSNVKKLFSDRKFEIVKLFFGQKIEAWISVWEALEIQRPTNRSLIERWCERKIILNQFETCGHFFIEHHHNPRHFFRKQKEIVLPFKNRFLTGGRVAAIYRFGLLQRNSIFELLRFCSRTLIPPLILLYNVDFEKISMKLSLCLKRPNKVVYLECFDEIQKWWIFMGGDESFWLYQMPDGGSREFATRCLRDSNNWKSLRPKIILNGIPFACFFLWNS